jgi:hypothetical protein
MATITVKREAGYADMLRAYGVVLDGQKVGSLRRGQEIVLQTTAGTHTLHVTIDWCTSDSMSFSIEETQSKSFECGNNTKIFLAPLYILLWPDEYLWLRPVP